MSYKNKLIQSVAQSVTEHHRAVLDTVIREWKALLTELQGDLAKAIDVVTQEPIPGGTGRELTLIECVRERDRILKLMRGVLGKIVGDRDS